MQRESPFETPFKHYITKCVLMICSNIVPFLFQLTFHKKRKRLSPLSFAKANKTCHVFLNENNLCALMTLGCFLMNYLLLCCSFNNLAVSLFALSIAKYINNSYIIVITKKPINT